MPAYRVAWLLFGMVAPNTMSAVEVDAEIAHAEQVLKDAHVAVEGPALLKFFRARTSTPADRDRLTLKVRQLGADSFAARELASEELVAAGRAALPFLRGALQDADAEIVRRARQCLDDIQLNPEGHIVCAAARVAGVRRPAGLAEVLLAYLPSADDEEIEEAVFAALVAPTEAKPDPALLAALKDDHALRRACAAHALGGAARGEVRQSIVQLMSDAAPRVRFEAAAALARAGEREAVPPLIALLAEGPPALAWRCEVLLTRVAEEQSPAVSLGSSSDADRRQCQEAWAKWWKTNGARADLGRLATEDAPLGLTLVCEFDGTGGGRVWEYGRDGKMRWEVKGLGGPNDVQPLPGGRFLVAERNARKVTERDRQGKVLWEYACANNPIGCQRLPNGNTLVLTFNELLEVTRDKKTLWSHANPGGFRHAVKARNGHYHFSTGGGQVFELDAAGKQLRTVTPELHGSGAGYWASVEPLPGGGYLLALGGANKVVEIDATGKVRWQLNHVSAVFATRLRNGNTLVASFQNRTVVEVDRNGKEVSRVALQGRPFSVRRY